MFACLKCAFEVKAFRMQTGSKDFVPHTGKHPLLADEKGVHT